MKVEIESWNQSAKSVRAATNQKVRARCRVKVAYVILITLHLAGTLRMGNVVLAAYDLSQPGSSTLSAPFCVMTSLPHCNRNAGSCMDGYTTGKAECIKFARQNSLTMKRMRAVESDSVKSARKAKDKLHKACERASETCERTLHEQEQNNAHCKHERVTRQCLVSNQHKKIKNVKRCRDGMPKSMQTR